MVALLATEQAGIKRLGSATVSGAAIRGSAKLRISPARVTPSIDFSPSQAPLSLASRLAHHGAACGSLKCQSRSLSSLKQFAREMLARSPK
jgi:hypothetical protein